MQQDDVAVVAQRRRDLRRQQGDTAQLELRRQAGVARAGEAQAKAPQLDIEPVGPGAATGAATGAVEEDRRVIDQRAQHAEHLRRRERPAPGRRVAREPVVVGAEGALIGERERGVIGQLVPGDTRPGREAAAARPLLHDRIDAERTLARRRDPKRDPFTGARFGTGAAARDTTVRPFDPRQPVVERAQRELPGRQPQQIDQRLLLGAGARIDNQIDHRLERGERAVGRHLAGHHPVAAPTRPAQRSVVPP